tara:strand:+ start:7385 stop:8092 length:708 start_codon:yes stop_codon:yes gene_type:complete
MSNIILPTSLTDYIQIYDNVIPDDICDELITRFESSVKEQFSTGLDGPGAFPDGTPFNKKFTEINFGYSKDWHKDWNRYFKDALTYCTEKYQEALNIKKGVSWPFKYEVENFRIKKYSPALDGQFPDQISPHVDASDHFTARRFLSIFWYLNDVEKGGETEFPHLNYRVTPKKGTALIFPPLWFFPHAGLPAVSGSKYIIHSYLQYPIDKKHFYQFCEDNPLKSGAVEKENDINK